MLLGLGGPVTRPLGARVGLSTWLLSQLMSLSVSAKIRGDFKVREGHARPPEALGVAEEPGWMQHPPFVPLLRLLVDERETHKHQTGLFASSLLFPSPSLHPHFSLRPLPLIYP